MILGSLKAPLQEHRKPYGPPLKEPPKRKQKQSAQLGDFRSARQLSERPLYGGPPVPFTVGRKKAPETVWS